MSRLRVASAMPGRIRLRAEGGARDLEELTRLPDALGSLAEVTAIQLRLPAYSAILHFDPGDGQTVWDGLRELGIQEVPAERAARTRRDTAGVVDAAARTLNAKVAERLDGQDLRQLLPLGLGLMSLREMVRGKERLGRAPWYVLAWYSSELFFRFHGTQDGGAPAGADDEEGS